MDQKLTPKQQTFIEEYLIDLDASNAAIRAGYSQKSAGVIGYENINKPHIKQAILKAKKARSERTGVDADWLLSRLKDEAEADVADLYNEEGSLKPVDQWPAIWRKGLVSGLDVHQADGLVMKIKLSDRLKRLELIGRHVNVGAFKDDLIVPPGAINLVINRPSGD